MNLQLVFTFSADFINKLKKIITIIKSKELVKSTKQLKFIKSTLEAGLLSLKYDN